MNKFINNQEFMAELFDDHDIADRAGEIGDAILAARSLRLTDIAVEMEGESTAGYKRIQRFIKAVDPRTGIMAVISGRCGVCDWRPDRDRTPTSLENRICRHAKRWQDEGFLGLSVGHAVSWAGHPVRIGHVFIQNHRPECRFAQSEPFSSL